MSKDDPAAARLAEMKILTARLLPLNRKPSLLAEQVAEYVPPLIAAIEAVLDQHQPGRITITGYLCKHHENHRFFSITRTEADDVRACRDCTATVRSSCAGCGPGVSIDACPVREAVTTALAGDDESDPPQTEAERRAADEALAVLRERLAGDGY